MDLLLLCIFHILQQVWKWLFERKHNILANHRPTILTQFKMAMYSETLEQMDEAYDDLINSEEVSKDSNLSD